MQTGSHPSRAVELPSSHSSPAPTLPSPQRGSAHCAGGPATQTPAHVVVLAVTRSGPHVRSTSCPSQYVKLPVLPEHSEMMDAHVPLDWSQFCSNGQVMWARQTPSVQSSVNF